MAGTSSLIRLPKIFLVIQCNVLLGSMGLALHLLGFAAGAYVIAIWLLSTFLQLVLAVAYVAVVVIMDKASAEDDADDDDEFEYLYNSDAGTVSGDEDDGDNAMAAQAIASQHAARISAIERLPVFNLAVACCKVKLQNIHLKGKEDIAISQDKVQHKESKAKLQNMESTGLDIQLEYTCGICLEDLSSEDKVFLFPSCTHFFHVTCVLKWLPNNGSCPICRKMVIEFPNAVAINEEGVVDVDIVDIE
ncbi:hypothetical protein L7F22_046236 [Adiantum nelumboides]|nr:hypothetical protein [Adiantum nelumboides]